MRLNTIFYPAFLGILGTLLACAPWTPSPASQAAAPQVILAVTPTPTIDTSFYIDPDQAPTASPSPERLPFIPGSLYLDNRPYRARIGDIIPFSVNDPDASAEYLANFPAFYSLQDLLLIENPQGDMVYTIYTGQTWPAEQRPPDSREKGEVYIPTGMTLVGIKTEIYDQDKNTFGCNRGVPVYFKAGDYPNLSFDYSLPYETPEGQQCSARAWTLGLYPAVDFQAEDVLFTTWSAVVYP